MDAFSVSVANGLKEPHMPPAKRFCIAGLFGLFQFLMPLIGWICVSTIASRFSTFQKITPWVALVLLLFLGIKMIVEAVKKDGRDDPEAQDRDTEISIGMLLVQGIATSIDALSVGFVIANYKLSEALVSSLIIGVVTFGLCLPGILIGRKFGEKLKNRAEIVGGIILIIIGFEIFIKSFF